MTFLQALILGIIQGLTEFLPISSSAHLVLTPYLLNWSIPEAQIFPFDVLVQLGTLVAVIAYFWKDLWGIITAFMRGLVQRRPFADPQSRLGWLLILASVPAGLAGVLIKDAVDAAFHSPAVTAGFLLVTAVLLVVAEKIGRRTRGLDQINWKDALWIGFSQVLSLFPGISRSGSTIAGGMTRHLDRRSAGRFSFLMSIPVMLAAGGLSVLDLLDMPDLASFLPVLAVGFITAAVVGYLSIAWLLRFLTRNTLYGFAVYCALLSVLVFGVSLLRGEQPAAAESAAPPQVIQVEMTPTLRWMSPAMNLCAQSTPGLGVVVHERTADQLSLTHADVNVRWGEPVTLTDYALQLGSDRLALVANPDSPLQSIPPKALAVLFSAGAPTWQSVQSACTDCTFSPLSEAQAAQEIHRLVYSAGEDITALYNALTGPSAAISANASIVPDPPAVLQTVAADTAALGFVPARWLNAHVREVALVNAPTPVWPVLAITAAEPQGLLRDWLACLQGALSN